MNIYSLILAAPVAGSSPSAAERGDTERCENNDNTNPDISRKQAKLIDETRKGSCCSPEKDGS